MSTAKEKLIYAILDLVNDSDTISLFDRARAVADLVMPEPTQGHPCEMPQHLVVKTQGQDPCEQTWLETLAHFKAPRPSGQLTYQERVAISQSIRQNGAALTQAALFGRRFEEPTQTFTPAKNLGIARTFAGDNFTKFINLSAAHKAKLTEYEKGTKK